MSDRHDPRSEYERRLAACRAALDAAEKRSRRISHLRLAVFLAGAALLIAAAFVDGLSYAWSLVPLAVFVALVVIHERAIRVRDRARAGFDWYTRGLARIDHTWPGTGVVRTDFVDDGHPYAADLDLFGKGSLFELVCTARTRAGEDTLARWLLEPAPIGEARARQEAVAALRDRVDLREDLALLADGVRSAVHPDALAEWGTTPPVFTPRATVAIRAIAWVLGPAAVITLVGWAAGAIGPLPFLGVAILELIVAATWRRRLLAVLKGIDKPERELAILAALLDRMAAEPAPCAKLAALRADLTEGTATASARIARLRGLVGWLDARRNQLFAPIAAMLMWGTHFGLAVEAWRLRHGAHVARWLAAVGEFEALCALSGYAYEHPADPFPVLVDEGPLVEGKDLGHPLLADDACVRNSVRLDAECGLWVVSGSNMSGKSTFLRVVGVAAVMAQAGAPVRGGSLILSPLSVGATIRIQDSLMEGSSRFYAEITRIRQLVELSRGERPLLFLLDEILHGTNSHDRRVGAEAIVRGLLDAGAIGLVTTHDLALAKAADDLGGRARNVHFDDRLDDGRLVFDYVLKPGVVERSNALELMRSVGLRV